LTQLKLLL